MNSLKLDLHRGEIYYIIRSDTVGSEMETGRPAVVVSNDYINQNSNVIEVCYLTTQPKRELPTHVVTAVTGRTSTILCEQISNVDVMRVGKYVTTCTPDEMKAIDKALANALGLEIENTDNTYEDADYENDVAEEDNDDSLTIADALIRVEAERDIYKNLYETLLTKLTGGKV
jgi:mRNA interferase MazF